MAKEERQENLNDPLESLRRGGPEADDLVHEYAPRLCRFLVSLGADGRTAEDLTQEVFLKLIRKETQYEERGEWKAFLFQIAYRLWLDEKRKRKLESIEEQNRECAQLVWSKTHSLFDVLHQQEMEEMLTRALKNLPIEQRVVFELGVIQGLRYREIAQLLQVPIGTVKSRIFLTTNKLKEMFAEKNRLYGRL